MTLRIILFFSLSMILAPTSIAIVGTIEEATEAGITGEEPEYIADAMFELNRSIHRFVSDRNMNDPMEKYALWHTMRVVMCAIYAAGRNAAEDVVEDASLTSKHTALGATRNVLLWNANFGADDDPGFEESLLATSKIVQQMIVDTARHWAQEALKDRDPDDYDAAIASRVTQWVALNILLEEFDAIVPVTYEHALDIVHTLYNPFREPQLFAVFYIERFRYAPADVMYILAPWLIHIVPLNLAGFHRRRFESFLGGTNAPRGRPIAGPVDIPMVLQAAAQVIDDILPVDTMDFGDLPDRRLR